MFGEASFKFPTGLKAILYIGNMKERSILPESGLIQTEQFFPLLCTSWCHLVLNKCRSYQGFWPYLLLKPCFSPLKKTPAYFEEIVQKYFRKLEEMPLK